MKTEIIAADGHSHYESIITEHDCSIKRVKYLNKNGKGLEVKVRKIKQTGWKICQK